MKDDDPIGFGDGGGDVVDIERQQRANIDDLDVDPFEDSLFGSPHCKRNHRTISDDGDVLPFCDVIARPIGTARSPTGTSRFSVR